MPSNSHCILWGEADMAFLPRRYRKQREGACEELECYFSIYACNIPPLTHTPITPPQFYQFKCYQDRAKEKPILSTWPCFSEAPPLGALATTLAGKHKARLPWHGHHSGKDAFWVPSAARLFFHTADPRWWVRGCIVNGFMCSVFWSSVKEPPSVTSVQGAMWVCLASEGEDFY